MVIVERVTLDAVGDREAAIVGVEVDNTAANCFGVKNGVREAECVVEPESAEPENEGRDEQQKRQGREEGEEAGGHGIFDC